MESLKNWKVTPIYEDEKAGVQFFESENYEEAVKCFNRVIKAYPDYENGYLWKAKAVEAVGKNDETKKCYEDALKASSNIFDNWPEMKTKYGTNAKKTLSCNNCQKENPKYKCTGCKSADYCSVECQKKHWSTHKTACAYSNRIIKTVVVDGMKPVLKPVQASVLKAYNWIECEVPRMIGVPLKVRRCGYQPVIPDKEISIFFMVDPQSGLADADWQQRVGIVQFMRSDFKDFSVDLFWDIYSYIFTLMDCYGETNFNYKRFEQKFLKPESFRNYQQQEHEIQRQYQKNLETNKKICAEYEKTYTKSHS